MKAVVAAFNQEKALVGAISVITNLRMELFEALIFTAAAAAGTTPRLGWDKDTIIWARPILIQLSWRLAFAIY